MIAGSDERAGALRRLRTDLRDLRELLAWNPWRLALAITWGVLALGSGLALAALAAWLIARAWQMPPVLDLTVAVVAVRALGISRGLCRYLERLATHDVALRAQTTARTATYRTLASSTAWLRRRDRADTPVPRRDGRADTPVLRRDDRADSAVLCRDGRADATVLHRDDRADATVLRRGDLLVRIGADIDDLGAVVVRAIVPCAVALVLSLAAVLLLALLAPPAALVLAAALLVSALFAPWLSATAAADAERAVRADRAEFTARAVTVLDHAAELRVAGRLGEAMAAAEAASTRAVAAEDRAAARSAWAAAALPASIGVSVLGALLTGLAIYGPTGGTTAGMSPMALAMLVLIPLSAFEAVAALPAAAQALTTGRAALHRLRALDPERQGSAVPTTEPALARQTGAVPAAEAAPARQTGDLPATELDSARSAPGAAVAAPNARFPERPRGARRIAVVGPSGAGKTTLLMHWAGLFGTPEPGTTFFAEDAHLFGTSILENLRVARGDSTEEEATDALRAVGLGDWLDTLPDGLDTVLTAGAAAVSGGQRRRLLLARALLAPADVLLLDEPTEHLEAEAGAALLRRLLDPDDGLVAPDRTVVVVTHQLPDTHRADLVLHLSALGENALPVS
ncbi:thiol reductant ABC exporter subunit CydC [Nocardia sp. NPDC057353]|uniref:thiol reductant ABC exporter subunit CydC n=1 Tax=Nocardia sp. NPDC057353 TaxID=3346104 RepID=UPI00362AB517